jgi:hypothetical protein
MYRITDFTTWANLALLAVFMGIAGSSGANLIEGGDFETGSNRWLVWADPDPYTPQWRDGMVVFPENGYAYWDPRTGLFQVFEVPDTGRYRVDLDFANHIVSTEQFSAGLSFPDVSFFEFDASGPLFVNGHITPSPLGADWQHYTGLFTLAAGPSVLALILTDFNGRIDGSEVWLDNVSINAAVPEPATMILMGLGISGLVLRAGSRRWGRTGPRQD